MLRKPTALIALLTALGLAFFCTLGTWQLRRAEFKEQLAAEFAASLRAPAVSLEQALEVIPEKKFVPVQLRGHYMASPTLLLDNQVEERATGVAVFNGFVSTQGQRLLIARGFLGVARDRLAFPNPAVPDSELTVRGILSAPPSGGIRMGEPTAAPASGPWLVMRIEPATLKPQFGPSLLPYVLLLDPADPHGFSRKWQPSTFGPERHRGYAVTWFGLAITVLVVFLALHRRR